MASQEVDPDDSTAYLPTKMAAVMQRVPRDVTTLRMRLIRGDFNGDTCSVNEYVNNADPENPVTTTGDFAEETLVTYAAVVLTDAGAVAEGSPDGDGNRTPIETTTTLAGDAELLADEFDFNDDGIGNIWFVIEETNEVIDAITLLAVVTVRPLACCKLSKTSYRRIASTVRRFDMAPVTA